MSAVVKSKSKAKTPKGAGKAKSITSFFQVSGKKKAPSPGKAKKTKAAPSAAAAAAKAAVSIATANAAKKKDEDTPMVVEKEKAGAADANNSNKDGGQDELSADTQRTLTFSPGGGSSPADDADAASPSPTAADDAVSEAVAEPTTNPTEAKMEIDEKEAVLNVEEDVHVVAAAEDEGAAAAPEEEAKAPTAATAAVEEREVAEPAAAPVAAAAAAEATPVAASAEETVTPTATTTTEPTEKKEAATATATATAAATATATSPAPAKAAAAAAAVTLVEVKPCVWSKHEAPEEQGGLNYYFNKETQESAWVEPEDFKRWEREKTAYADAVAARRKAKLESSSSAAKPKSHKAKGPKMSKEEREKLRVSKLAGKEAAKATKAAERTADLERKAAARAEKDRIEKGEKLAKQKVREEEKLARDKVKADEKQKKAETLEADKKRRENEKAKIIEEKKVKREALEEERRKKKEAIELEKKQKRETLESEREANRKRKSEESEKRKLEAEKASLKRKGATTSMQNMFKSFVVKPKLAAAGGSADAAKAAVSSKAAGKFSAFYCPPHMTLAPAFRVNPGPLRRAALDIVLNGGEEADDSEDEEEAAAAAQPSTIEELRVLTINRWRQCMQNARCKPSTTAVAAAARETAAAAAAIAAGETPMTTATMTPEQKAFRRRMKLLSFHIDVRPAYFGTFGKESKVITGRKPLAVDKILLDYEYDSEGEYEPGDLEEGDECLSADEDDEEADAVNNAEEGEDNWMVPHGYLSDDEVAEEEDDDELGNPMKKARKMASADGAPSTPTKRKTAATRYSIGCKWGEAAINHSKLGPHAMQIIGPAGPIDVLAAPVKKAAPAKAAHEVPTELYPKLIKMVHGSHLGTDRSAAEFTTAHPEVSKAAVARLIKDTAFCVREVRAPYTKQRRFVQADMLEKHNLTDLPLPEPIVVEKAAKAAKAKVPAELMPELIKLVHGSLTSADRLVAEFSTAHADVTKAAVSRLVKDKEGTFCVREVRAPYTKQRRFVLAQVLEAHNLTDLALPEPIVVAKSAFSESKNKRSIAQAFEKQIGPWTKHLDPGSKQFYYFNQETGASSWEKPTTVESPAKAAEAAGGGGGGGGAAAAAAATAEETKPAATEASAVPAPSKDGVRDPKRIALGSVNPNMLTE